MSLCPICLCLKGICVGEEGKVCQINSREEVKMGNNMTLNAIKGVHFLRNTCTNGLRDPSSGITPTTTSQSQPPPPPLLSRKSVVRKALRRPSKVPKKNGIGGLAWDELGNVLLLNNKVRERGVWVDCVLWDSFACWSFLINI